MIIAFKQQVMDITIHMRKNDGLENYLPKKKTFYFSHPGDSHLRETDSIPGRLPDEPGGFTCMRCV